MSDADDIRERLTRVRELDAKRAQLRKLVTNGKYSDALRLGEHLGAPSAKVVEGKFGQPRVRP